MSLSRRLAIATDGFRGGDGVAVPAMVFGELALMLADDTYAVPMDEGDVTMVVVDEPVWSVSVDPTDVSIALVDESYGVEVCDE